MSKPKSETKPNTSRRERGKADKMRRILAAGEKLFSRQGFDGTTVQKIADEADVAVGTLFLYVSDKSELLLTIFHNAIDQELKQAATRLERGKQFVPAVKQFLLDLIAPYERNPELAKVFCREFLFHKGRMRTKLDEQSGEVLHALKERILTAQAKGEIDDKLDSAAGALQLYAIFNSTLAFHLAECLPGSPSLTIDSLLQVTWHGMAPRS